jgi:hypothetical protein
VVARLALDEADEPDRLMLALRQRFRTPADMLRALGIDISVLEEGESMRTRDTRSRDQEEMSEFSPDRRSRDRGRDQDPEEEREFEELMALLQEMPRRIGG